MLNKSRVSMYEPDWYYEVTNHIGSLISYVWNEGNPPAKSFIIQLPVSLSVVS